METLLLENDDTPIVTFGIANRRGSAIDPVGLEGLTYHCTELSLRGSGDLARKEFDEAVEIGRRLMASAPGYARGLQRSAASFGHAGRADLAVEAASRLRELQPDFSEDYVRATYPFRRAEDLDIFIEGLRKARCLS